MENRCACCGSIIPEGKQVCSICKNDNTKHEVGDILVFCDENQCIKEMTRLAKAGIKTDFLYKKDEEQWLCLEVTEVCENGE